MEYQWSIKMQIIFPSLMAKSQKELDMDFQKLKGVVKTLHLDIVDGKFAKNRTFQFPFKLSQYFQYHAHLMVKNPEKWIDKHGKKVDAVVFHPEAVKKEKIADLIKKIKDKKKQTGLALKPETEVKEIRNLLGKVDYVLILTVHPGFYGGKFLGSNLKKIRLLKKINPKIKIIVDGGMRPQTIKRAKKAGADFFVSGAYTTKAAHPKQRIKNLIEAVQY